MVKIAFVLMFLWIRLYRNMQISYGLNGSIYFQKTFSVKPQIPDCQNCSYFTNKNVEYNISLGVVVDLIAIQSILEKTAIAASAKFNIFLEMSAILNIVWRCLFISLFLLHSRFWVLKTLVPTLVFELLTPLFSVTNHMFMERGVFTGLEAVFLCSRHAFLTAYK